MICDKCGMSIKKNDLFCTNCGNKVEIKKEESSESNINIEKSKSSHGFLKFLLSLFIFFLGFALAIYLFKNYDMFNMNSNNNIDYSNKNVTIDDTGIADAVEKVYDSVVVIESYISGHLYGSGSGFVYNTDSKYGYILTNNHVITKASEVDVVFNNDTTKKIKVDVVGKDEFSDVAVLRVDKKYVLQVAQLGENDKMRVGDTTFAVGAPLDSKTYSWSVTRGILSGKNRLISSGSSYMNVLQTDTPINSGNSGGPLCNANGEVIGITNMKLASDSIEGIGFAIPIETAISYAEQFVSGTSINRPYIGVSVYEGAESFFSSDVFVIVNEVVDSSPAEKAGLKSGDIIVSINGEKIQNSSYFRYKLYSYKVGDTIKITISREGKEQTVSVKLESRKDS